MLKFIRALSPAALLLLAAPPVVHAQKDTVASGGTLTINLNDKFSTMLANSGATVSYIGTGPSNHGEHFSVSGGTIKLSNGYGTLTSMGATTFTEGSNTLALDQFGLTENGSGYTITAEVYENGTDEGRLPVFTLNDELFQPPLSDGKYKSGPVKFTFDSSFLSTFEQYIPVAGLTVDEVVGNFKVSATLDSK